MKVKWHGDKPENVDLDVHLYQAPGHLRVAIDLADEPYFPGSVSLTALVQDYIESCGVNDIAEVAHLLGKLHKLILKKLKKKMATAEGRKRFNELYGPRIIVKEGEA